MGLLAICVGLLAICMGLLVICTSLPGIYMGLLAICMGLLAICMGLLPICTAAEIVVPGSCSSRAARHLDQISRATRRGGLKQRVRQSE